MSEPSVNYHVQSADRLSYSRPLSKWTLPEAEQEDSCHNYSCWWWIFCRCANVLLARNSTSQGGSNGGLALKWRLLMKNERLKLATERRRRGSICYYFVHLAALEYQHHNTYTVILKHIGFEQPSLNGDPAAIPFILLQLKHVAWPRPCGKPITQLNTLNTNAHAHRCTNYPPACVCSTLLYM